MRSSKRHLCTTNDHVGQMRRVAEIDELAFARSASERHLEYGPSLSKSGETST